MLSITLQKLVGELFIGLKATFLRWIFSEISFGTQTRYQNSKCVFRRYRPDEFIDLTKAGLT